jgi:hypothetical protein
MGPEIETRTGVQWIAPGSGGVGQSEKRRGMGGRGRKQRSKKESARLQEKNEAPQIFVEEPRTGGHRKSRRRTEFQERIGSPI